MAGCGNPLLGVGLGTGGGLRGSIGKNVLGLGAVAVGGIGKTFLERGGKGTECRVVKDEVKPMYRVTNRFQFVLLAWRDSRFLVEIIFFH